MLHWTFSDDTWMMEVRPMVSWSVLLCRLTCRVRSSTQLNVWFACLSVCSSITLLYNFNTTQTYDRVVFTKDSVKMLHKQFLPRDAL